MGLFNFLKCNKQTKQHAMSALLPPVVNLIYAQTQTSFEDFIAPWEAGNRIKVKRSVENKCESTALLMSLQASQWMNSITEEGVARQCVREMVIMLAAATQYSMQLYEERLTAYLRHCGHGEASMQRVSNQFFFLMEPMPECMETWTAFGKIISSGGSANTLQTTMLFEKIFKILDINAPFIGHINSAA